MKAYKATMTVVSYGKTEDEAAENLLFDVNEATKDGINDSLVSIEEIDTEEEGIDDFDDDYMALDEVIERNLKVDIDTGKVLDEYMNEHRGEDGCCQWVSDEDLKIVREAKEYK